eukprot:TRINITY_DN3809_c0_g1_i1.p1 TRINITY_DN3809_c0_g1~~TRINITY_DN3809_c0_g1_i1.p1  ORF type:complete len:114 (-),score=18.13 TRINITY_DN3809_c0_g1_i1:55-396(-)
MNYKLSLLICLLTIISCAFSQTVTGTATTTRPSTTGGYTTGNTTTGGPSPADNWIYIAGGIAVGVFFIVWFIIGCVIGCTTGDWCCLLLCCYCFCKSDNNGGSYRAGGGYRAV